MSKKMIMFVDDDERFLDGMRRLLHDRQSEWEMVFMQDPVKAVEGARKNRFDVIITDEKMPVMDGFGLIAALQADPATRDVPVIFLTGSEENSMKRRALDIGATDLLSKPVDREELLARIRNTIRLKEYQDAIRKQNEELDAKVRERTQALEASQVDVLWRLARVSEFHDEETGDHILRVGMYSRILAKALGQDDEYANQLLLTAPLHDIGKIAVPDSILLKPDRLTDEERREMQRHCAIGAEMLSQDVTGRAAFSKWLPEQLQLDNRMQNPLVEMAAGIAMTHHERWDGSGYPLGLNGEEIPLAARITGIADVFDALTSNRPYRKASTSEEALEVLRLEREKHDPEVFAMFESRFSEILECREHIDELAGNVTEMPLL